MNHCTATERLTVKSQILCTLLSEPTAFAAYCRMQLILSMLDQWHDGMLAAVYFEYWQSQLLVIRCLHKNIHIHTLNTWWMRPSPTSDLFCRDK